MKWQAIWFSTGSVWSLLIKFKFEKAFYSTVVLNWDCMIHSSDSFQRKGGVDKDLGKWYHARSELNLNSAIGVKAQQEGDIWEEKKSENERVMRGKAEELWEEKGKNCERKRGRRTRWRLRRRSLWRSVKRTRISNYSGWVRPNIRVVLKKNWKVNFLRFKDLQYVALEFG